MDSRPSKDEWFTEIALVVSKRSSCQHTSNGAVLVDANGFVVALGYNGAPRGLHYCELDEVNGKSKTMCDKHNQCMCIHAELNAIISAARHATLPPDMTLYSTGFPCCPCMKAVIQAGVKKIVFVEEYHDEFSHALAKEAGIELVHMSQHPKRLEGRRTYEPREKTL